MLYSAATIQNNTAADQLPAVDHVRSAAQESREKEANNYSKGEVFPLSPTGRQFCVGASQGMVITYKKIRFNSHLTRDNTQYASGFTGSVSRLLPSCLLLKLANHKKLYCLIKHAVEHYQKKLLTRKKAKAIKAIATKQMIWLNSISLLSFKGIFVTTLDHAQTETVLFLQTVTERRLIVAGRGNALHVFALPF